RDRVDHKLAVRIAGGPEKQTRTEFAAGNDQGVGHVECSSNALSGAHDLDAVARLKRRLGPCRAWHNGAVDCDRDAALAGVDGFFFQQRSKRRREERLILPIDADVYLSERLCHRTLLHSAAARRDPNRSMRKGRMAGSAAPSSTSCAIASAVIGVSRIPLR